MRTFIQRGSDAFELDLDHVKAYDSGLMTDSTKASYYVACTRRWTGRKGMCGGRDSACTQRYCGARHSFSDGGADPEFQAVGEGELAKERKTKPRQ